MESTVRTPWLWARPHFSQESFPMLPPLPRQSGQARPLRLPWLQVSLSEAGSLDVMMRLAFSGATLVDPEILIVDEILAVGDERFQKKSSERMMNLMGGGTTVLMVSHNINQIREMCSRTIWLQHGQIRMDGDVQEVCDAYQQFMQSQ